MANLVGKMSALGMAGGVVAPLILTNPKTEKGEKVRNNAQTAAGMAALTVLPFAAKEIVSRNPQTAEKVAQKAGTLMEKGIKYVVENTPKVIAKMRKSKMGQKIVNVVAKAGLKVLDLFEKNPKIGNAAEKVVNALEKFSKSSTATKGKIGLIAVGAAALLAGVNKLFKNYYKNEGKIEQKYEDLRAKYERWVKVAPIMDAQTGKPISFEQFCVMAQTYVK
ncbi:hypothetical protein IJ596_05605 [bacterium]|nr:hypothetical protein [bacterium]